MNILNINKKTELHPWRVIISVLFDLESDTICDIIDTTGLSVDWSLPGEVSYSHKTRKREYRPRIQAAYDMLNEERQLQVSSIVASELVKRHLKSELNNKLSNIGWKLEGNRITTSEIDVLEMFFPQGTQHDAYVKIKSILQQSIKSLVVIDPYIENSIFQMLKSFPDSKNICVKLLTYNLPSDFNHETKTFLKQYCNFQIEVRKTKEFHDRFVIIDSKKCYHIGASIKDAGNKAFMISQIEDNHNVVTLINQQKKSWNSATKINI